MQKRLWQEALVVVSAMALASCSSSDQVSIQSGGMTHTFTEGKSALSKDFPLPIYPGAQTAGSVASQDQSDSEHSKFLLLSTSDSLNQVETFYRAELLKSGWHIEQVDQIGSQEVNISCAKSGLEAGVSITAEEKKTDINLQISKASLTAPVPQGNSNSSEKQSPATD